MPGFRVKLGNMVPSSRATPGEFGEALKGARAASGIALEGIAERTKISLRMLAALEAGSFGKLPDRVFARMFLRQYLDIVGLPATEWLKRFEAAWQMYDDASKPNVVLPAPPIRRTRLGPWAVGLMLVAFGVAGVVLVANRSAPRTAVAPAPLPAPPAPVAEPMAPAAAPPLAAPAPTPAELPAPPPQGVLIVRAETAPCWVEVHVAGEKTASRLLPARSTWQVDAAGKDVDLLLGDAGAASVEYLGKVRRPAGASGAVARIHLEGSQPAAPHP
jgi:cytoskeleton protein RodZ